MKKGGNFIGVIPPVVTPFKKDGKVDEPLFKKEVKRIVDCGVHGISVGGSTGEGAFLEDEELSSLIAVTKKIAPHIPLVAGVIRPSTNLAVRTSLVAKKAGADALMVTPTFYNILVPDQDGNFMMYKSISDAANLPIVIYNVVPQNEITVDSFASLLKIKNVVGIKQSLGGIMACYDMVRTNGKKGMIYSATDEMMFSTFELGADGAISAILALFPRLCMDMWNLARQGGKTVQGLAIQNRLFPLWKALRGPQFPARMKAVMRLVGYDVGYSRNQIGRAHV